MDLTHHIGAVPMSTRVNLLEWFLHPNHAELVDRIGTEVAQRCFAAEEGLSVGRARGIGTMRGVSVDFIRGYVRALAAGIVRHETDATLRRHRAKENLRPQVVASATDQLIDLVVHDLLGASALPAKRAIAA